MKLPDDIRKETIDTINYTAERAESDTPVYPTGIGIFDRWIDGGIPPGCIVILPGFPGACKSMALHMIMHGLYTNSSNAVLVETALDDSKPECIARWVANLGQVDKKQVQQKRYRPDEASEVRVAKGYELFREMTERYVLIGSDDISSKLDKLPEKLKRIFSSVYESEEHRPQLVVGIDSPRNFDWSHIQGLVSDENAMVTYYGKRIKDMIELQVDGVRIDPILITTEHLRKPAMNNKEKQPTLNDIKGTIETGYDGNLIVMVHNDLVYRHQNGLSDSRFSWIREDLGIPLGGSESDLLEDPVIDLKLLKSKIGRMYYRGNSHLFCRLYSEQMRMEPIEKDSDILLYGMHLGE